jgi:hypothetical protein
VHTNRSRTAVALAAVVLAGCGASGHADRALAPRGAHAPRIPAPTAKDDPDLRFGPEAPVALIAADDAVVAVGLMGEAVEYRVDSDRVRWSAHLDLHVASRPAMSPSTVVFTGGHEAVAVDRATGGVRWRVAVPNAGAILYPGSPSAVFLVTSGRSELWALDEQSGARRWSTTFDSSVSFGMAGSEGTALVLDATASAARLRAFDAEHGTVRWQQGLPPTGGEPSASGNTFVIAVGDEQQASLLAFDVATGTQRWSTPLPRGIEDSTSPAPDERSVAVLDAGGTVHLIDMADGRIRWSKHVSEGPRPVHITRSAVLVDDPGGTFILDRAHGDASTDPVFSGNMIEAAVAGDVVARLIDVDGYGTVEIRPV